MMFRLVAGLQVHRETTRFLIIMQFWPDGFSSLTKAFWSRDHQREIEIQEEKRTEPLHLFASLRVIYVVIVIYLLICAYHNANPLMYLLTLPGNTVSVAIVIALMTLGMSYLADRRRITGQFYPTSYVYNTASSVGAAITQSDVREAKDNTLNPRDADSSNWTGRGQSTSKA
jgi:hypothetical protein